MAKQVNGDESKSKLLEKIAKQTFRASEIVNSLLNFSRTSSTAYEEVDLNRIARETLQLIHPQLTKAHIHVEEQLDASLGTVRGNAGKLQQVFLNLFLNARDAMESGGTLTVVTSSSDVSARVEIIDSGCGIPEENLARIGGVSRTIGRGGLAELRDAVLHGLEPELIDRREVRFRCSCSREGLLGSLVGLPPEDLGSIRDDEGRVEAECSYCGARYLFQRGELATS